MKKESLQKIIILVMLALVGYGIWYVVDQQPRMPDTANASFSKYNHYLKRKAVDAELEVYIEPVTRFEAYSHYITVVNPTDDFYCGTLKVWDVYGELCYDKRFLNLRPKEERIFAVKLDALPLDYQWEDVLCYRFTYPEVEVDASVLYDANDEGYYWMDVIVPDGTSVEQCMEYAERIYIQDILAGMDSLDLVFYYQSDVRYEKKHEVSFPRLDTACFGALLSQKEKTIVIVDWENEEEQILLKKEMK